VPNYKTITKLGSVSRAKDFLQNPFWVCIGRTTPWDENEDNPPEAIITTVAIDEPILYKHLTQKYHVQPVTVEGDFYIDGQWYKVITEDEARDNLIPYVLLTNTITYNDIGDDTITFRQIGVYSRLIPKEGYENHELLTPDQVEDPGWLEWYANLEPVRVQPNQTLTFYIVIVL